MTPEETQRRLEEERHTNLRKGLWKYTDPEESEVFDPEEDEDDEEPWITLELDYD